MIVKVGWLESYVDYNSKVSVPETKNVSLTTYLPPLTFRKSLDSTTRTGQFQSGCWGTTNELIISAHVFPKIIIIQ